MDIPVTPGVSLPLWDSDEAILADSLNLRERRYGGSYLTSYIGYSTSVPVITMSLGGELYSEGKYGFMQYSAAISGNSLLLDNLSFSDNTPVATTVDSFDFYGVGREYGFVAYGHGANISSALSFSTSVPAAVTVNPGVLYGDISREYGFVAYGVATPLLSTMMFDDSFLLMTVSPVPAAVYGSGVKYGFCVRNEL